MESIILAIRGAITVDEDRPESMVGAVGDLFSQITRLNALVPENIVSIQFTQTADLRSMNAAAALRTADDTFAEIPLFCSQEPEVDGMLKQVVRVLVTAEARPPAQHVYLKGARLLRPDLADGNT